MSIRVKNKIFTLLLSIKRKNIFICQHCLKFVLGLVTENIHIRKTKRTIYITKDDGTFKHLPLSIKIRNGTYIFSFEQSNEISEILIEEIRCSNPYFTVTFRHGDKYTVRIAKNHFDVKKNQMEIIENEETLSPGGLRTKNLIIIPNPHHNQKHIDIKICTYYPNSGFKILDNEVRKLEDGSYNLEPVSNFLRVKEQCSMYLKEFLVYFEKYDEVVKNFKNPLDEIGFIENLKLDFLKIEIN